MMLTALLLLGVLTPTVSADEGCTDNLLCSIPREPLLGFPVDPVSPEPIPTPPASAFHDSFEDVLSPSETGGRIETGRNFTWCGDEGEGLPSCFCNGVVRYGGYPEEGYFAEHPEATQWSYRRNCGNVDCDARNFNGEDPLPGSSAHKICQCAEPQPQPVSVQHLKWVWCANEDAKCICGANSLVRFGATGSKDLYAGGSRPRFFIENPQVTRWKYHQTPVDVGFDAVCEQSAFAPAEEHPWPEDMREPNMQFMCQCARLPDEPEDSCDATPTPVPTPVPKEEPNGAGGKGKGEEEGLKPWEVKWTWCANEGSVCMCLGTVRYGHSGQAFMYEDHSKWFKENPDVFKWVNAESNGDVICNNESFAGLDPFPDHKKLCQCAHGVPIDIFAPFRLPDDDGSVEVADVDRDGEVEPSPQVMLERPNATSAGDGQSSEVQSRLGQRVYHHKMHRADKKAARDMAQLSDEEMEKQAREDEIAAMKSATAAIAEREGFLPALPGETAGDDAPGGSNLQEADVGQGEYPFSHYIEKHASLGAAAPSSSSSSFEVLAYAATGIVAAAAVAAAAAVRRGRKETLPVDMQPLLGEAAERPVATQEYCSVSV